MRPAETAVQGNITSRFGVLGGSCRNLLAARLPEFGIDSCIVPVTDPMRIEPTVDFQKKSVCTETAHVWAVSGDEPMLARILRLFQLVALIAGEHVAPAGDPGFLAATNGASSHAQDRRF